MDLRKENHETQFDLQAGVNDRSVRIDENQALDDSFYDGLILEEAPNDPIEPAELNVVWLVGFKKPQRRTRSENLSLSSEDAVSS